MSKAALVIDMPESCDKCRMAHLVNRDQVMCSIDRMTTRNYTDATKDRPDWCPLVPMPERKQNACSHGFAGGWNAAIDAIGGNT